MHHCYYGISGFEFHSGQKLVSRCRVQLDILAETDMLVVGASTAGYCSCSKGCSKRVEGDEGNMSELRAFLLRR
jgi:hypothetical protein